MSDAWFSSKLAPDGDVEDGCQPDGVEALKRYLHRDLSPSEAAQAITMPVSKSADPKSELPRLNGLLIDALIELPIENLQAVLTLIKAIESLPEPDLSTVEKSKLPSGGKLWHGLPGFGHEYADEHQSSVWHTEALNARDADERGRLRDLHVRKAEVEARLAVGGLAGIPIDWGYDTVTRGLERAGEGNDLPDFWALAAAKWLEIAAAKFWEGAGSGEQNWGLGRGWELWAGGDQMTKDRFRFWRDRLGELRDYDEELVDTAREVMRAVEGKGDSKG